MSAGRLTFTVFLILQVADGLITYVAVAIFGSSAEANPLLRTLIHLAGAGPALLVAKLLACGCGTLLYLVGTIRTLAVLTALYLFGAIVPWLHVLSR